jgi:hypothetical protein
LRLTDTAACHLARLLDRAQRNDDDAIRLEASEDGWRLTLDSQCSGDATFAYEGRKVLLLSAAVAKALEDSTLGLSETENGCLLQLTGPAGPLGPSRDA